MLERTRPDSHTVIFTAILAVTGLVLVGNSIWVWAHEGWAGRLGWRPSQRDITIAEALTVGAGALGLAALVLIAGWPRRRGHRSTPGEVSGLPEGPASATEPER